MDVEDLTLSHMSNEEEPGAKAPGYVVLAMQCERPFDAPLCVTLADTDVIELGRGPKRGLERRRDDGRRIARITVVDPWMSSLHARLLRDAGRWLLEDAESKNGTLVNGTSYRACALAEGDLLETGHTLWVFRASADAEAADGPLGADAGPLSTFVPGLARELRRLTDVATSMVPVLLCGETGTGKEVVARAVHALSERPGAFVAVNCGALPETLVESELFGHRRGAFSGAVDDRPGLVRSADRGTLLLDEIGDLRPPSQAALLRVLQERQVVPLGGSTAISVDFRLVCATHHALPAAIERGEFRSDLYARLAGFVLSLPPLRDRREDLGWMTATLLRRLAGDRAGSLKLTLDAARALFRHPWPRNVRELERALEAAVAMVRGDTIELSHLPPLVGEPRPTEPRPTAEPSLSNEDRERRAQLLDLLREHAGNLAAVARVLGKDRAQVHRWIKRFGIAVEEFRR